MNWIKARLAEPSTWYGLGYIVAGAVSYVAPTEWNAWIAGAMAALGSAAVVKKERA